MLGQEPIAARPSYTCANYTGSWRGTTLPIETLVLPKTHCLSYSAIDLSQRSSRSRLSDVSRWRRMAGASRCTVSSSCVGVSSWDSVCDKERRARQADTSSVARSMAPPRPPAAESGQSRLYQPSMLQATWRLRLGCMTGCPSPHTQQLTWRQGAVSPQHGMQLA